MIALPLVAGLVHLAVLAALAPGVELDAGALPWITAAQLPLMGVTAAVHGVAADRDDQRLSSLAMGAFGLGVTVLVTVLLVRYGVSVGPADPYGGVRFGGSTALLWYAGFLAIAALGHTFFIGRPIVHIASAMLRPLRRRSPHPAIAVAVLLASGLGGAAAVFLDSATGSEVMEAVRQKAESDPGPVIAAGAIVAVVLNLTKHAVVPRR